MKNLFSGVLLVLSLVFLSGCSAVETFTTWAAENDESSLFIRGVIAADIYRKDALGSDAVCERAFRYSEGVTKARGALTNNVLTLSSADRQLSELITGSRLNPEIASVLLDATKKIVIEHAIQASQGTMPENAKVTLNALIDTVDGVAERASVGCK